MRLSSIPLAEAIMYIMIKYCLIKKVKELKNKYNTIEMVGDGINDAPTLVTSDIGIAIGAGTDIAIESAYIIIRI